MISLDNKIFNPSSAVARRMIQYGEKKVLYIIAPYFKKEIISLSPTVTIKGSGGSNKISQLWRLYGVGEQTLKEYKVDIISAQDPFFIGLVGLGLKKQFKLRLEIQMHGDFYGSKYYRTNGLKNRLQYYLGKYIVRRADRIRVVGQRIKKSLIPLGVPEEKIVIRPVALDVERLTRDGMTGGLQERYPGFEKIFLALNRLDPVKNIPWLLVVFKQVLESQPKAALVIVGDGPQKKRLLADISRLQLQKNVFMEPFIANPAQYLKTADAVVFPSLSEGYGLVPMEAAALGTPVIMSDVGVANYELQPSEKVTILPVNDVDGFKKAMLAI